MGNSEGEIPMLDLPNELIIEIILFLDIENIFKKLKMVNKRLCDLIEHEYLFKTLTELNYPEYISDFLSAESKTWREYFLHIYYIKHCMFWSEKYKHDTFVLSNKKLSCELEKNGKYYWRNISTSQILSKGKNRIKLLFENPKNKAENCIIGIANPELMDYIPKRGTMLAHGYADSNVACGFYVFYQDFRAGGSVLKSNYYHEILPHNSTIEMILDFSENNSNGSLKYIINNKDLGIAMKNISPNKSFGVSLWAQETKITILEYEYKK